MDLLSHLFLKCELSWKWMVLWWGICFQYDLQLTKYLLYFWTKLLHGWHSLKDLNLVCGASLAGQLYLDWSAFVQELRIQWMVRQNMFCWYIFFHVHIELWSVVQLLKYVALLAHMEKYALIILKLYIFCRVSYFAGWSFSCGLVWCTRLRGRSTHFLGLCKKNYGGSIPCCNCVYELGSSSQACSQTHCYSS